jgi:hypothetical protein
MRLWKHHVLNSNLHLDIHCNKAYILQTQNQNHSKDDGQNHTDDHRAYNTIPTNSFEP